MLDGLRLAFTVLTVLPIRGGRFDRSAAAVAMSVAPFVGAVLGLALGGILWCLRAAHAPGLLAAAITVAVAALLTRGMHLDGLADTADALGSYRKGEKALEIMKKSDIGPFGVAAIGATLLIQAAALTVVSVPQVVIAYAAGRLAIALACRRGVPAARPEGLGALVAETVPAPLAYGLAAALIALAALTRTWQGPAAVAVAAAVALFAVRHCVRRFGGITGDVLGACVELSTTVALIVLTLG